MMPVAVIGGYLGAGKTTLVNHLLRHAGGTRIAVLVNEFGSLPIDADLIETQDEDLISIAGGCVCCSYGNDLIQALMDLSRLSPAPDHVLIESSGVALPGAIAATVGLMEGIALEAIIVLCDSETIRAQAANDYIGDTITRQLEDADLLVLNKSDLVAAPDLDALDDWLAEQAPGAARVRAEQGRLPPEVILQEGPGRGRPLPAPSALHALSLASRVVALSEPVPADEVARLLADPALGLMRAKGFVPTHEGLQAIQVVGRRWRVSPARAGAEPGLVLIGPGEGETLDAAVAALERFRLAVPG